MRQSLSPERRTSAPAGTSLPLHSVAGWCCEAAGGAASQAERVTAAWLLLYVSAHLFDSVQDGDPPDERWAGLDSSAATNLACGLLASAWAVVAELEGERSSLIRQDFAHTVLRMSSGQHSDLTKGQLSLDQAWAVAEAKSGAFFALACRSGARIAGASEQVAQHYGEYGLNLGLMIQVADDVDDLQAGNEFASAPPLPMAYSLATAAPQAHHSLVSLWQQSSHRTQSGQIQQLLAHNGASLYLAAKLAQFRQRGLRSLQAAAAAPPARGKLAGLLSSLDPSS